ncbi:NUDIX domain-containing protein [Candidatus Woesearchaeota archaeon]|nr:NUDIX domain-containing protein [Candidatus Woesearchaeota archaeon]
MERETSYGAIVFRKERKGIKYLLLHYGAGHWEFPRGHPEAGEGEKDTVLRELKEETGISKVKFIEDFRKEFSFYFRRKTELVLKTVVFYLLETSQKTVKLSFEHIGYRWANLDLALKTLTFKDSKKVIELAHIFLTKEKNK